MSKHFKKNHTGQAINRVKDTAPQQTSPQINEFNQPDVWENFKPDYDSIQLRAYQIYQDKGGDPVSNWLEAEQILKQEYERGNL